jgi:hypothetical protein
VPTAARRGNLKLANRWFVARKELVLTLAAAACTGSCRRTSWLGRRFVLHSLGQKGERFRANRRHGAPGPNLDCAQDTPAHKETAMTRASVIDDSSFWSTIEDAIDDEFSDVIVDAGDEDFTADWYQDSPEITVPKQCLPHWRTVH